MSNTDRARQNREYVRRLLRKKQPQFAAVLERIVWELTRTCDAPSAESPAPVLGAVVEEECMIGDRWGVSGSETLRAYPCDDFVTSPTLQAWRGVHVAAPAAVVWPWVTQVRLAPYAYDWIDNLGRRSPRELAGLPEPQAGDRFTTAAGRQLGQLLNLKQLAEHHHGTLC